MFPIVMSDSEFQVACVGEMGEMSCITATDIAYVAFRQGVFEKELETGLQKDVQLHLSPSISSFLTSVR